MKKDWQVGTNHIPGAGMNTTVYEGGQTVVPR